MDFWQGYFYIPYWISLSTIVMIALYMQYFTWNFNYWKSQGIVVATRPLPFFGSAWKFMFKPVHVIDMEYLKTRKGKAFGLYEVRDPVLIVQDLELIKELTIKSFHNFTDRRRFPVNPNDRISKYFLTMMDGEPWKMHRSLLSPIFTSGKLRQLCGLMEDCGKQLTRTIHKRLPLEKEDMDVKLQFTSYAMDVISTCCFGYKIDAEDPDDPFLINAKSLFTDKLVLYGLIMMFMPKLIEIFNLSIFSQKSLNYFQKVVNKVVKMRKNDNITRSDFLQLLLDVQQRDAKEDNKILTEEALASHVTLFLLAGFDTTSTTMAAVAYLLALNPDCQEKLAQEIDDQRQKHGKLTSEVIMEMKYLDMVISESLRYFPSGVRLERRCVRDCELGGIKIKKDVLVLVPVFAIHHSEDYYPNPEKFDPERFTPENKASRNPMTYMPFGAGPRSCLGMRFALQEVKIGLAYFFSEFRVSPSNKTEIPIKFKKGLALLLPVNGIHLKVEKRN